MVLVGIMHSVADMEIQTQIMGRNVIMLPYQDFDLMDFNFLRIINFDAAM